MLPETFDFIDQLATYAKNLNIEVLVEIHSHYKTQIDVAKRVDWVYDFALPPLVLHALHTGQSNPLKNWLSIRPQNAVTVLDTHDGIGIIDIGADKKNKLPGLIPDAELDALVEQIHKASHGQSRLATGSAASNLDLYQVNCTYYDALGRDDMSYLIARALQFFVPGIPQVYYVGLLAGTNDMTLLEKTKVGRDINRHYYSPSDFASELQKPVVQKLIELIQLRNNHPAFNGVFTLHPSNSSEISMRWETSGGAQEPPQYAQLTVDFEQKTAEINYTSNTGIESFKWLQ
jgi:sucrose phosphorylase